MEIEYTKKVELSWKNVFNPAYTARSISGAFLAARDAKYPFVAWNGYVYASHSEGTMADRIIEAERLPV